MRFGSAISMGEGKRGLAGGSARQNWDGIREKGEGIRGGPTGAITGMYS